MIEKNLGYSDAALRLLGCGSRFRRGPLSDADDIPGMSAEPRTASRIGKIAPDPSFRELREWTPGHISGRHLVSPVMRTLLRIDASIRSAGSHSRDLADQFEAHWLDAHPGGRVLRRDLARDPVPHLNEDALRVFMGLEANVGADTGAKVSELLVGELEQADDVVVASPVYNFNTPSPLKAWVDHVVRSGRTFAVQAGAYRGLLAGKSVLILTARGGVDPRPADGLGPFLDVVFRFMGFSRVEWIALEGTAMGVGHVETATARARKAVRAWFRTDGNPEADGIEWRGVFTSEDRAGIQALRAAQVDAILRGDAEAYAELCTDDIVLMLQGCDVMNGRDAFLECEQSLFASTRFRSIRQLPSRVERDGLMVVETGESEVELDGVSPEAANYRTLRKYTHVLRKTAAGWRFAVLMSNNSR